MDADCASASVRPSAEAAGYGCKARLLGLERGCAAPEEGGLQPDGGGRSEDALRRRRAGFSRTAGGVALTASLALASMIG
ncbi:hypothetical protein [Roseiflexus castenholzii]|uniref:hypothetical protein n=1 Tax=Roseiflexus castenholzii TaxID=120962 RepID=UPI0012EDBD75|nr:hypothetical protein [Roseiflexus castenholzii]